MKNMIDRLPSRKAFKVSALRAIPAVLSLISLVTANGLVQNSRPSTSAATSPARTGAEVRTSEKTAFNRSTSRQRVEPSLQVSASNDEDDDPDLPPFMQGKVNKDEYLRLRDEHIALLRGFSPGVPFDISPRLRALRRMDQQFAEVTRRQALSPEAISAWTPIGPAPIPNGQTTAISNPVSGRVTAIAVHPTDPNVAYLGTAQGGVFRTTNGGNTWTPLMDAAQSLVIGAITIDPLHPSVVFVGTGEPNSSLDCFPGVGLYRIDNADSVPAVSGPFEQRVGGTGTPASDGHAFMNRPISRIMVDPTNDNRIFVGCFFSPEGGLNGDFGFAGTSEMGLYFSENALSSSPTFSRIAGIPGGNGAGVTDVLFEPGSSNNLVVGLQDFFGSASGIYRTANASAASVAANVSPTFARTMAPTSPVNIKLAISKVRSGATTTVTVLAATAEGTGGALRESRDGGQTFPTVLANAGGYCGPQCFYDIAPAVDPDNASIIYLGGAANASGAKVFQKSTNGGLSFGASDIGLHADVHAVAVAPSSPSTVYLGCDGGAFRSTDSGATWTSLNNAGLDTIQYWSVAAHPTDQSFSLGGSQDNGTHLRRQDGTWTRADFGDGGFALIDQNATDASNVTMYHTYFNKTNQLIALARVTRTACAADNQWVARGFNVADGRIGCEGVASGLSNGIAGSDSVLFYAPMALGPGNPNTLYFGTDRLYRSANRGDTMSVVSQAPFAVNPTGGNFRVSAIGISPTNDKVRIVGLENGQVFATTTGSASMTNVTGAIPARYVTRAVVDPTNSNTAYVTLSSFGLNAGRHVWKTTNLNATTPVWSPAGGSGLNAIPDVPVDAFVIDPVSANILYAGTDVGVYRSTDGGTNWSPFGTGLPRVAVFGMAIQPSGRLLRVATHGRGMWEVSIPQSCSAITVGPASIPSGTAGVAYPSTVFSQTGGVGAMTFALTGGALPAGLTLSPSGVLSGTPTQTVTNRALTIRATDSRGCSGSVTVSLNVLCPAISLRPSSVPTGTVGVQYAATQFTQTGGVGSTTFSVTAGTLPSGLILSSSGLLSGTPTQAVSAQQVTITARDSNGCAGSAAVSLTVLPGRGPSPAITSISPPTPTVSSANQNVSVFGTNFRSGLTVTAFFPSGGSTTLSGTQIHSLTTTSFVMVTTLNATGTWRIRVNNSDGTQSGTFNFTVRAPSPAISSISPASPTVSSANQNVSVFGTNFRSGLTVTAFFPSGGSTTLSGTQIHSLTTTSFVMVATLNATGTWGIRVNNSDGTQSGTFNFTVRAPSPVISSISPASPTVSGANQNVSVFGANFRSGLTVTAFFPSGGSTTLSGTQIQSLSGTSFVLRVTLGARGNWGIRVNNADGSQSNTFNFTVR
jgi:hypothetical protein